MPLFAEILTSSTPGASCKGNLIISCARATIEMALPGEIASPFAKKLSPKPTWCEELFCKRSGMRAGNRIKSAKVTPLALSREVSRPAKTQQPTSMIQRKTPVMNLLGIVAHSATSLAVSVSVAHNAARFSRTVASSFEILHRSQSPIAPPISSPQARHLIAQRHMLEIQAHYLPTGINRGGIRKEEIKSSSLTRS